MKMVKTEIEYHLIDGRYVKYYRKTCSVCHRQYWTRVYKQKFCGEVCQNYEKGLRMLLDEFIAENGYYKAPKKKEYGKAKPIHISASAVVYR